MFDGGRTVSRLFVGVKRYGFTDTSGVLWAQTAPLFTGTSILEFAALPQEIAGSVGI